MRVGYTAGLVPISPKDNPKRSQAQYGEAGPADRGRGIGARREAAFWLIRSKESWARAMLPA